MGGKISIFINTGINATGQANNFFNSYSTPLDKLNTDAQAAAGLASFYGIVGGPVANATQITLGETALETASIKFAVDLQNGANGYAIASDLVGIAGDLTTIAGGIANLYGFSLLGKGLDIGGGVLTFAGIALDYYGNQNPQLSSDNFTPGLYESAPGYSFVMSSNYNQSEVGGSYNPYTGQLDQNASPSNPAYTGTAFDGNDIGADARALTNFSQPTTYGTNHEAAFNTPTETITGLGSNEGYGYATVGASQYDGYSTGFYGDYGYANGTASEPFSYNPYSATGVAGVGQQTSNDSEAGGTREDTSQAYMPGETGNTLANDGGGCDYGSYNPYSGGYDYNSGGSYGGDYGYSDFGGFGGGSLEEPVILNLDGKGIAVTPLSSSNQYADTVGDGRQHRTAWASAGNGVLVYDPNNTGQLTQRNQIVFTDWDPTATTDMQALADVFDTNHNGTLDAGDAGFANFKIMVTNADGTTSMRI